ncbi:MAG: hypothetical protein CMF70_03000 [Magnetovibrio sp.]|nr:hypothetical protein [Magnetovibrio sp.]|tara:strand:+ start:712 stop:1140 length:429 start_codon:yes stop_codon:yes gene_type:complete
MKCIVTGGAGFIGSHLTERLLNDRHSVSIIDNFSTGRPENLQHLLHNTNLSIFEGKINNKNILEKAISGAEWVFHLAALADIVPSIERPIDDTDEAAKIQEIYAETYLSCNEGYKYSAKLAPRYGLKYHDLIIPADKKFNNK